MKWYNFSFANNQAVNKIANKKTWLCIICAAALVGLLVPSMLAFAEPKEQPAGTDLNSAIVNLDNGRMNNGVTYYLSDDLNLQEVGYDLVVPVNSTVTLDLNGHTITGTGNSSVITVCGNQDTYEGGTLTIIDSSEQGSGTITGGAGTDTSVTFTYYEPEYYTDYYASESENPAIKQVTMAGRFGGGILVSSGAHFTMEGGTITGNTADNGAGIYVGEVATATLKGGAIINNKATRNGGGIYEDAGFLYVSGEYPSGSAVNISNNSAENGAGLYAGYNSRTSLYGGNISDNKAVTDGGGIYSAGKLTLDAAVDVTVIKGNTAGENGGGICFYIGDLAGGSSEINGGAITENVAGENGGGVYAYSEWNEWANNSQGQFTNTLSIAANSQSLVEHYSWDENYYEANVTLCNNTAKTSGDDLYMESGYLTMAGVPTEAEAWTLAENHDRNANKTSNEKTANPNTIVGWYTDGANARWSEGLGSTVENYSDGYTVNEGYASGRLQDESGNVDYDYVLNVEDTKNAPVALKAAYAEAVPIDYYLDGSEDALGYTPAGAPDAAYSFVGETISADYALKVLPRIITVDSKTYQLDEGKMNELENFQVLANGESKHIAAYYKEVYAVSFIANGGAFDNGDIRQIVYIEKTDGATVATPAQVPTREGYNFEGWCTKADNGQLSAYNFDTVLDGDRCLYAKWKADKWKTPAQTSEDTQTSISIIRAAYAESTNPNPENNVFTGWYTGKDTASTGVANTGNTQNTPSGNSGVTQDKTVYAGYQKDTVTLMFVYDPAWEYVNSVAPVTMEFNRGDTVNLATLKITGHENEGIQTWLWEMGDMSTAISQPFVMDANKTVYNASYQYGSKDDNENNGTNDDVIMTLELNGMGRTIPACNDSWTDIAFNKDTVINLDDEKYTPVDPDGYKFTGWSYGLGDDVKVSGEITLSDLLTKYPSNSGDKSKVILYANWEPGDSSNTGDSSSTGNNISKPEDKYTLTFDTDGGSSIDPIQGSGWINLSSYVTTKEGYTFDYWSLDGSQVANTYYLGKDVKLVAVWKANNTDNSGTEGNTGENPGGSSDLVATTSYLSFETGDGASQLDSVEYSGVAFIDLTKYVPTKEGYTFTGWHLATDETQKVSKDNTSFMVYGGDITLVAEWEPVSTGDNSGEGEAQNENTN